MVAGNIGSAASKKFSVIGDQVNLGARLESTNKNFDTRIMPSERSRDLAGAGTDACELDLIRVKGKRERTLAFELLAQKRDDDQSQAGHIAYRAQDWDKAEKLFNGCLEAIPDDPVPEVFLKRCTFLRENPPGPDWDGVWEYRNK